MAFNKSGKFLKSHNFLYDGNHPVPLQKQSTNYLRRIQKQFFCIRKSLCSENMNVVLHMKLFDSCVKPILLYCSEIWKNGIDIETKYDSFHPNRIQM
jgi:hypothetical protein